MDVRNAELVTDTSKSSNLRIHQAYQSSGLGTSGRSPIGSNEAFQLALDVVGDDALKQYTLSEVAEHWEAKSCWIVLFDFVFDVTKFLHEHPGGREIILEHAGIDATLAFKGKGHSEMAHKMLIKYCIGQLVRFGNVNDLLSITEDNDLILLSRRCIVRGYIRAEFVSLSDESAV